MHLSFLSAYALDDQSRIWRKHYLANPVHTHQQTQLCIIIRVDMYRFLTYLSIEKKNRKPINSLDRSACSTQPTTTCRTSESWHPSNDDNVTGQFVQVEALSAVYWLLMSIYWLLMSISTRTYLLWSHPE
jgi:hypothetical protein